MQSPEQRGRLFGPLKSMNDLPDIGEATVLKELVRRGFTDGFRVVDGGLRSLSTGTLLRTEGLVIRDVYRFEGVSDPDDMAVVYAIESATGVRGTLVDAFGVYADPAKAAALAGVSISRRARSSS